MRHSSSIDAARSSSAKRTAQLRRLGPVVQYSADPILEDAVFFADGPQPLTIQVATGSSITLVRPGVRTRRAPETLAHALIGAHVLALVPINQPPTRSRLRSGSLNWSAGNVSAI